MSYYGLIDIRYSHNNDSDNHNDNHKLITKDCRDEAVALSSGVTVGRAPADDVIVTSVALLGDVPPVVGLLTAHPAQQRAREDQSHDLRHKEMKWSALILSALENRLRAGLVLIVARKSLKIGQDIASREISVNGRPDGRTDNRQTCCLFRPLLAES